MNISDLLRTNVTNLIRTSSQQRLVFFQTLSMVYYPMEPFHKNISNENRENLLSQSAAPLTGKTKSGKSTRTCPNSFGMLRSRASRRPPLPSTQLRPRQHSLTGVLHIHEGDDLKG